MVNAITDRNLWQIKRVYAFQAGHVVAIMCWVGATLVVSVDAAFRAEIVSGGACIELVNPQSIRSLNHMQATERNGCGDGAPAAAI